MTENQKLLFLSEYNQRRKDRTTGLLLTLFLGGFGAHRFYLGQVGLGVLYLVFSFLLVPFLVAFIELFLIMGRVDRYNEGIAADVAMKVKVISNPV